MPTHYKSVLSKYPKPAHRRWDGQIIAVTQQSPEQ